MTETDPDDSTLIAARACDADPIPRIYAHPDSLRIIFANAAAANDLRRNRTQLNEQTLLQLLGTTTLSEILEDSARRNRAATINLRQLFPNLWDSASVEYVGLGLTRFVKLSVQRCSAAAAPERNLRAYDRTANHLLHHSLALLSEQGGQSFSLRKVARRAGVGLGHLQYYFRPRHRLLQAMADAVTLELLAHFEQHIATRPDPGSRLLAVIDYVLKTSEHAQSLSIVRELRLMARDDPALSPLLSSLFQECRRLFAELFRGINPELDSAQTIAIASDALSLVAAADEFIKVHPESTQGEEAVDYRAHLTARILGLVHGNVIAADEPATSAPPLDTAEQVDTLMGVAQAMVKTHNARERLQALCAATTRLLNADHAGIYLGSDGAFACQSNHGNPAMPDESLSQHVVPADSPLMQAAAATRGPVVVNDTHGSPLVDPASATRKNIHAIVVVALFDPDGQPCGFLSSEYNQRLAGFGQQQGQLLQGLARLGETIVHADAALDRS